MFNSERPQPALTSHKLDTIRVMSRNYGEKLILLIYQKHTNQLPRISLIKRRVAMWHFGGNKKAQKHKQNKLSI